MNLSPTAWKGLKVAVFIACLLPAAWILWRGLAGDLGANPPEAVNRFLGDWALRFILAALAVTPLRLVTGQAGWMRFRRMIGLFAFFYALLHVTSYVVLDQFFAWADIWADIVKRRYITVGMIAILALLPLAVTSTKGMVKRLGGRRWKALHRLAYVAGVASVVHFIMMVKADLTEPLIYAALLALLFAIRLAARWKRLPKAGLFTLTPTLFLRERAPKGKTLSLGEREGPASAGG